MFARLGLGAGGSPGALVGERGVGVRDAEDACAQRYLLAAQRVRVAAAAKPLVVPADEELDGALGAGARGLLLADDGVARKVEPLGLVERAVAFDVVAAHRHLADVVEERGEDDGGAVGAREAEVCGKRVGEPCHARRVRVCVALELVAALRQAQERLAGRAFALCKLDAHRGQSLRFKARRVKLTSRQ